MRSTIMLMVVPVLTPIHILIPTHILIHINMVMNITNTMATEITNIMIMIITVLIM